MEAAPTSRLDPKWRAFGAIGVSFVTNVAAMSMVFVALPSIADDFGITLRAVAWVVIAQSVTISSLMLPMGRLADMFGRKRMHLLGLTLFGIGAVAVAFAPSFGALIAARVLMSIGNAMGQSVGTAMVVAVFPEHERGKAIGAQTTAVAVGAASGPIFGGLVLQVLPWEAMFLLLLIPISVAIIAGYIVLDEAGVGSPSGGERVVFDWTGAALSALAVVALVLTVNNPLAVPWFSPLILIGATVVVGFGVAWVWWERRTTQPMLDLSLFSSRVFSTSVGARLAGFTGSTFVFFLLPIFLISLRGMSAAAAAGVLFLNSIGMGVAAQISGRTSDRVGSRGVSSAGFCLMIAMAVGLSFIDRSTPLTLVMPMVFLTGLSMGLWNVPNNSVIMGTVSPARHGVVGALTNLVRNMGNVTGQATASAVVVGVMAARGFDIPLSEINSTASAGDAFVAGWQWSLRIVALLATTGLLLTLATGSATANQKPPLVSSAHHARLSKSLD